MTHITYENVDVDLNRDLDKLSKQMAYFQQTFFEHC